MVRTIFAPLAIAALGGCSAAELDAWNNRPGAMSAVEVVDRYQAQKRAQTGSSNNSRYVAPNSTDARERERRAAQARAQADAERARIRAENARHDREMARKKAANASTGTRLMVISYFECGHRDAGSGKTYVNYYNPNIYRFDTTAAYKDWSIRSLKRADATFASGGFESVYAEKKRAAGANLYPSSMLGVFCTQITATVDSYDQAQSRISQFEERIYIRYKNSKLPIQRDREVFILDPMSR